MGLEPVYFGLCTFCGEPAAAFLGQEWPCHGYTWSGRVKVTIIQCLCLCGCLQKKIEGIHWLLVLILSAIKILGFSL